MTTTLAAPAPTTPPPAPGFLRRYRAALVVGVGLVLAVAFAALGAGATHGGVDDPQNPHHEGARALAQVLRHDGIDVTVVRSADAFEATAMDASTTVVVTSTENLGASTIRRLKDHLGLARLVLVEPRYSAARAFGADDFGGVDQRTRTNGSCADLRFDELRIDVESATTYPSAPQVCFRAPDGGAILTEPSSNVTLLGSTDLLSNEHITRADNAAVALRLLGQSDHLVWYVPDIRDLSAGDGVRFSTLLPRWLRPAGVLLVAALLAFFVWRGRRLGRLAVEPLPVAISAIESTRSRARLYRKVDDRAHAAQALRAAARRRLADRLGLPRTAADDPAALVRDLAPYTRLGHAELQQLLADGPVPASDHDLIRLADDLAALMREVHDS